MLKEVRITIPKCIKQPCVCLMYCYLRYMIGNLAIFNHSILAKGVPFLFQAGQKAGNSSSWFVKSEQSSNAEKKIIVLLSVFKELLNGDLTFF